MITLTDLLWCIGGLAVILVGLAFIAAAVDMPRQERKNKAKGGQHERKR
jgi:hypothetical protein